jgi:hypothetical protein
MFFGSLLVLIATDLMWEWLLMARKKMLGAEYLVCLGTFLAIHATGIEVGMVVGVLLAMVCFVVAYAQATSQTATSGGGGGGLSLVPKSSTVVRSYEERSLLIAKANRGRMVTIQLKGYIFFGSAVKILEEVKRHLNLNTDINMVDDGGHKAPSSSSPSSSFSMDQAGYTATRKEEEEAWRGRGSGSSPQYMHEASLPQQHMFCMTMAGTGTGAGINVRSVGSNNNNNSSNKSSPVAYRNGGGGSTDARGYVPLSMQGDDHDFTNHNHRSNHRNSNNHIDKALQTFLSPNKLTSSAAALASSSSSTAPIPIQTTVAAGAAGGGAHLPSVYSMSGEEVSSERKSTTLALLHEATNDMPYLTFFHHCFLLLQYLLTTMLGGQLFEALVCPEGPLPTPLFHWGWRSSVLCRSTREFFRR